MYSIAYDKALKDGEARNNRIPIIIVGSDRVGKSSLRKHLLGLPFHNEEPSTNGIEVEVVELTAENAKDPWVTIAGRFFTNEKEAEDEALKNAAKQVLHEDQKGNTESNRSIDDPYFQHETTFQMTNNQFLKMQELIKSNDFSSEQPEPIKLFVHDFAGQSIFYDTHFCFLKMLCPYLLVVDASLDLDEPAQSRFKFKSVDVQHKLNDPILETNLDSLLSWLTVLERLSDFFNENHEREDLEFKLPPVVIVLTNVDRCKGNIDEAVQRIEELLSQKAFQNVFPGIFLIDNTSIERNGSEIRELRGFLYELTTSILKKQPPMPVRWLKFEGVLSNMMLKEGRMHISIEDAREAAKLCKIADADAALKFLHHQAIIVRHSESQVVVLSPPWLMNFFTEIITVPPKKIPKDAPFHNLLRNKGILMQHYIQRKVDGKLLEDLMKQFSLICPWKYEGKCAYIVPSVAPLMDEGEDVKELLEKSPVIPGFIHFNWSYVPLGYYTRFQIQMIKLCREDLLRIPELYCNYTLLSFCRNEGKFDVYLIKIPGIIKIGIVPREVPDREDPNPATCSTFINFLRKTLKYCLQKVNDQEPLIYGNVAASLMVKCSCSWRSETCRLQHSGTVKCIRDECCHFWHLDDLQNLNDDPVCEKSNLTTTTFSLDCVKLWLYEKGTVVFKVLSFIYTVILRSGIPNFAFIKPCGQCLIYSLCMIINREQLSNSSFLRCCYHYLVVSC